MKRRSAASSTSWRREPAVFFLDRSLGRKTIAAALRMAGAEVRLHDDFFPPDAPDAVWLAEAGRRGWAVLTKDRRIRYRTLERRALASAGVAAFVLTARGDLRGEEMAAIFVKALPAMAQVLASHPRPFVASVSREGRVRMVLPSAGEPRARKS